MKRAKKKLKKKAPNLFNARVETATWQDKMRLFFYPAQSGTHEGHEVKFKIDGKDGTIYVLSMRRVA